VEIFNERERREWQRTAWLAAAILNAWSSKRIRPKDLLPDVFPTRIMTKEEKKRELEEIKKAVKG